MPVLYLLLANTLQFFLSGMFHDKASLGKGIIPALPPFKYPKNPHTLSGSQLKKNKKHKLLTIYFDVCSHMGESQYSYCL